MTALNPYWKGGAPSVKQVQTITPASVGIGNVFSLVSTGEDASTTTILFTATAATVANVTAGLVAAWNASTNADCTGVVAADNTTNLTLTSKTAGVPFGVASSGTGGSATLTSVATTANSGPNDWGTAANWSTAAVPVNTDNVTIDGRGSSDILYGTNQQSITLGSILHYSCGIDVGQSGYALKISATVVKINQPPADGSIVGGSQFSLDTGTNATTCTVFASPLSGTSGIAPVLINGSNSGNILNISGGIVGLGTMTPALTGNFPTVNQSGGTLAIGPGITVATLNKTGGTLNINGSISGTLTNTRGNIYTSGTGALSDVTLIGGTMYFGHRPGSGDAITGTLVWDGGNIDLTPNPTTFSVSATTFKSMGQLKSSSGSQFSPGTATFDFSNGGNLQAIKP